MVVNLSKTSWICARLRTESESASDRRDDSRWREETTEKRPYVSRLVAHSTEYLLEYEYQYLLHRESEFQ